MVPIAVRAQAVVDLGSTPYVPWSSSPNSLNSLAMVRRMFEHAEATDGDLYAYLQAHCGHLLSPGPHTGIPVTAVDRSTLVGGSVPLPTRYSTSIVGDAKYDSGVYFIINEDTGSTYFGSARYEGRRLDLHYHAYHKVLTGASVTAEATGTVSGTEAANTVAGSEAAGTPADDEAAVTPPVDDEAAVTPPVDGLAKPKTLYPQMVEEGGIERFR